MCGCVCLFVCLSFSKCIFDEISTCREGVSLLLQNNHFSDVLVWLPVYVVDSFARQLIETVLVVIALVLVPVVLFVVASPVLAAAVELAVQQPQLSLLMPVFDFAVAIH